MYLFCHIGAQPQLLRIFLSLQDCCSRAEDIVSVFVILEFQLEIPNNLISSLYLLLCCLDHSLHPLFPLLQLFYY
jgi:hypothetical protein